MSDDIEKVLKDFEAWRQYMNQRATGSNYLLSVEHYLDDLYMRQAVDKLAELRELFNSTASRDTKVIEALDILGLE